MARRRRRAGDSLIGFGILTLIAVGVLGWIKDNVVDFTTLGFWLVAGALAAVLIAGSFMKARAARRAAEQRRAEITAQVEARFDSGVDRAVQIATHQGWVSPHRLRSQFNVTEKEARDFLDEARGRGALMQAANGRYYLPGGLPQL
jgi:uncharacterized protein (DUF58 family)